MSNPPKSNLEKIEELTLYTIQQQKRLNYWYYMDKYSNSSIKLKENEAKKSFHCGKIMKFQPDESDLVYRRSRGRLAGGSRASSRPVVPFHHLQCALHCL